MLPGLAPNGPTAFGKESSMYSAAAMPGTPQGTYASVMLRPPRCAPAPSAPQRSARRYRHSMGYSCSVSSMLLAMPSGIQKCPPKSAPSASLPAGSAPIMLLALTAMYGAPEGCCPAMMVPYQCGCAGPRARSRSPGGPAATIFAMTDPDRLISSSIVKTPAGLTAAGKSAQDRFPGTGSNRTRRYTPP